MLRVRFIIIYFLLSNNIYAQSQVGLIENGDSAFKGYTLFHPDFYTTTYLLNNEGLVVHEWPGTYTPGRTVYLLDDGSLLRTGVLPEAKFGTGGSGGYIELVSWAGTITWSYRISTDVQLQHHDVEYLPNGNMLVIVWDKKTIDDAISQGRNPEIIGDSFWSEKILELKPIGKSQIEIVWEWDLWDHLVQDFDNTKENYGVVSDSPNRIDINYISNKPPIEDYIHANAIDYNAELDQVLLSANRFSEIWIIDHSTTIDEAKTSVGGNSNKGGDILYRWGNPHTYHKGEPADQKLYGQHDPHWIPKGYPNEGNILIFNNGLGRNESYSSIDMIEPPYNPSIKQYDIESEGTYLPLKATTRYMASNKTDFFSGILSGAQQLMNGNLLICEGIKGNIFETDMNGETVWQYVSPFTRYDGIACDTATNPQNNTVFRASKYAFDHPAFSGKSLIPGNGLVQDCIIAGIDENHTDKLKIYPNPVADNFKILSDNQIIKVEVLDVNGNLIFQNNYVRSYVAESIAIDLSHLKPGLYYTYIYTKDSKIIRKIIKK